MKRRWIYLSLVTGLIILAGVMFIDFYRNINKGETGALRETTRLMEQEAQPVLQPEDELSEDQDTEEKKDSGTDERSEPVLARITFFGDVLLHDNVLADGNRNAGGNGDREDWGKGFDFKPMFTEVRDLIEDSDFTVINQSGLVGVNDSVSALSGYPRFNGPSCIVNDYIELGFDGVNTVSNHALDLDSDGWKTSVDMWRNKPIHAIGAYRNQEEIENPANKIVSINGIRVAFLSYVCDTNYHLIRNQDIGIPYATVSGNAVKKKEIQDMISTCRRDCNAVIVQIHWSGDASFEETDFEKETAQFLADVGADAIIGNGPKALQKTEWLTGKDGKKVLCAYSLGNTVCSMQYIENLLGAAMSFSIEKDENGGISIKNVSVVPTMIVYDKDFRHIRVIKLSSFDEAAFDQHGSNLLYGKGSYDWLNKTVLKQIPIAFLPASYR